MNCSRFQNLLYDYVDAGLSARKRASAEKHLSTCGTCRQSVEDERLAQKYVAAGLRRRAERISLNSGAAHGLAKAVERRFNSAGSSWMDFFAAWRRVLAPVTIVLGLVLCGVAARKFILRGVSPAQNQMVQIYFAYPVPVYQFSRTEDLVIDSLTYRTAVVEQTYSSESQSDNQKRKPL